MILSNITIQFTVTLQTVELDIVELTLQAARQLLISGAEQIVYNKEYDSVVIVDCPDYPALRSDV